jgi:tetratricopeptide (TPR) repeat protein
MKQWSVLLVVGSLMGAGAGWGQGKAAPAVDPRLPRTTQASQLAIRAEEMQAAGKAPEAAALFQQAAELTPDDWGLWDRAGWAYLDAAQAAPALKAFESARKAAPAGTRLYGGLLISQFALGKEKEVLDLLKQYAPPDVLSRAGEVVKKGLAAKERTADWNFALGYLYARVVGNSPRGIPPLEEVVKAAPANAEAWLLLAELNQAANRGAQEDAAAVKYLELAPETQDAYRLRAQRYAALKKNAEALAEYDAAIAKYPEAAELYYGKARLQERLGGLKEAEATYGKLIAGAEARKQEALRTQARAQLANFQARQQNYAGAEKYYREAAARPDASVPTWTTWGSLLALTGKWDEAAKALDGAADRDEKERGKTDPSARDELLVERYHAAVCRVAAGQKEQAKAPLLAVYALRNEVRTSPEREAAAFLSWLEGKGAGKERLAYQKSDERWAGFTWRRQPEEGEMEVRGRFSPAATSWRAILQQVQKRNPDCWPADYALARIYASGGATDSAVALLNRVALSRPDWWAPHYALGEYYARQRQKEKGTAALKKTLQLAPACGQAQVYLSLLKNLKPEDED